MIHLQICCVDWKIQSTSFMYGGHIQYFDNGYANRMEEMEAFLQNTPHQYHYTMN